MLRSAGSSGVQHVQRWTSPASRPTRLRRPIPDGLFLLWRAPAV